jgi:hypothetical protein
MGALPMQTLQNEEHHSTMQAAEVVLIGQEMGTQQTVLNLQPCKTALGTALLANACALPSPLLPPQVWQYV